MVLKSDSNYTNIEPVFAFHDMNYRFFDMNDESSVKKERKSSIVIRDSRFVNEFHILKATFKFCTRLSTFVTTFPFFSFFLWYNRFMAGYFSAQKPDVSCDLQIL